MTTFPPAPVLQVHDLCFSYPGQPALAERWSAQIPAGLTLLHGDTGSGKSTLLRLLAGAQAAEGRLTLGGTRFDADPAAYRRSVFWHEPGDEAFDPLTPRELARAVCGDPARFDEAAWQRHAAGFGLASHLHKALFMLSTGSRRKAMLAAALASECTLTLLDEPAAALDAASVDHLTRALIAGAAAPGRAIIVASSGRLESVPLAATIELPLGSAPAR